MKKLVFLLTLLMVLTCSVMANAAERVPFRIARVPIIVTSALTPIDSVLDGLEKQIDRATHVPLNGTLGAVEYLDETECGRVYADILDGHYGKILKREAPAKLAELMEADLVIIPQLIGYEEYVRPSWHWDRREIVHSYAAVKIEGYDRAEEQPFAETVTRSYDDEYSLHGQVERLAADAMAMVLDETRIHNRVWRWKEKSASNAANSTTTDKDSDVNKNGVDSKNGN